MAAGAAGGLIIPLLRDSRIAGADALLQIVSLVEPPGRGGWIIAVLVFAGVVVVATLLHELGHVILARANGLRTASLTIWRLTLVRRGDSFRLEIGDPDVALGQAAIERLGSSPRMPLAMVYLGGPLMNLVTAGAGVAILASGAFAESAWLRWGIGALVLVSMFLALELVPATRGGHESDGSRLRVLLGGGARARAFLSLLAIQRGVERGTRPRDIPQRWFSEARNAPPDSRDFVAAQLLSYAAALDRDETRDAATYLDAALGRIAIAGAALALQLRQEAAFFTAWASGDAETARAWRAEIAGFELLPALQRLRIEIAIACAERRFDDALRGWEAAAPDVDALAGNPQMHAFRESWLEWRDEITSRAST
jgi:hypothetical protein